MHLVLAHAAVGPSCRPALYAHRRINTRAQVRGAGGAHRPGENQRRETKDDEDEIPHLFVIPDRSPKVSLCLECGRKRTFVMAPSRRCEALPERSRLRYAWSEVDRQEAQHLTRTPRLINARAEGWRNIVVEGILDLDAQARTPAGQLEPVTAPQIHIQPRR
jgi:hypothetical protein